MREVPRERHNTDEGERDTGNGEPCAQGLEMGSSQLDQGEADDERECRAHDLDEEILRGALLRLQLGEAETHHTIGESHGGEEDDEDECAFGRHEQCHGRRHRQRQAGSDAGHGETGPAQDRDPSVLLVFGIEPQEGEPDPIEQHRVHQLG